MRAAHRVRLAVNLANGSTLAGVGVALAGRARLARAADGLLAGTGYRLPLPAVPAFTIGSVIVTRQASLPPDTALFRHEARHTTQYAWCGLLMLPLYVAAAGASWVLSGDFGAWNAFERQAGLADGGYAGHPLRPVFRRLAPRVPGQIPGADPADGTSHARGASETGRPAAVPDARGPGPGPAGRAGSTATPSR